jgi:hypothetical protein
MMNNVFLSTVALMMGLISNSVASCDPVSSNPAANYSDCVKKVAQTFKTRANNISKDQPEQKDAILEDLKETAKYEKDICRQTCKDAPQPHSAG